jgi:anti-sigma-K factor RskA
MSDENHISEDDLVLFALQFLPDDQMRAAREHLKSCESCRTAVGRLQGDLAAYAMTSEVTAPPAAARERLMRQVAKEPRMTMTEVAAPTIAPVRRETGRREPAGREPRGGESGRESGRSEERTGTEPTFSARQSRGLAKDGQEEEEEIPVRRSPRAPWVLAWTGWAVAAGCSFVAGLQLHQRQQVQGSMAAQETRLAQLTQSNQQAARAQDALATLTAVNAQQVALHLAVAPAKGAAASVSPEALAAYIAQKGALVFVATHLQPVAPGKTYELWLLPADAARSPIPVGTFKPDAQGSASIVMPQLPKGIAAKGFGVTVENEGGSGTPTLPILMTGA